MFALRSLAKRQRWTLARSALTAGHLDQAPGGDEQLPAQNRVGSLIAGMSALVVEASEGTAGDTTPAHVCGGLIGIAGDAIEQHAMWLRRWRH